MSRQSIYREAETVKQALDLLEAGTPMCVFDLETTGLNRVTDRILSCSALKVVKEGGVLVEKERMDIFLNPGFPIPKAASDINHITDEVVAGCELEDTAAYKIRQFFGEKPLVCGYNSKTFDEGFVNAMYTRVFGENFTPLLHLDVFRMAKEKLELASYKLEAVAKECGADVGLDFHTSICDVIATTRVLNVLLDAYDESAQPAVAKRVLYVKSVGLFNPSHRVNRMYVRTMPYTKTYFDLYKSEWVSDLADVDFDKLQEDLLRRTKTTSIKELVKKLQPKEETM